MDSQADKEPQVPTPDFVLRPGEERRYVDVDGAHAEALVIDAFRGRLSEEIIETNRCLPLDGGTRHDSVEEYPRRDTGDSGLVNRPLAYGGSRSRFAKDLEEIDFSTIVPKRLSINWSVSSMPEGPAAKQTIGNLSKSALKLHPDKYKLSGNTGGKDYELSGADQDSLATDPTADPEVD